MIGEENKQPRNLCKRERSGEGYKGGIYSAAHGPFEVLAHSCEVTSLSLENCGYLFILPFCPVWVEKN